MLAIILGITSMMHASAQEYRFFGPEQVGSTLITSITQDNEGFVWVGTERGLDRFDGYHFASYKALDGGQRPSVVASILPDADGTLWVGTAHGLFHYTGSCFPLRGDEVTDIAPGMCNDGVGFAAVLFPDSLLPRVASLAFSRDGRLLAGTAGYGLYEIDRETLTARRTDDFADATDASYFNLLFIDGQGLLWKRGIDDCIEAGNQKTIRSSDGMPVAFFERGGYGYVLCQHGIIPLRQDAPSVTAPRLSALFLCSAVDDEGNVYVGTRGEGIFWLPRGESAFRRMSLAVSDFDLDHARVEALFADSDGNLWVGCSGRGLMFVARQRCNPFQTWDFASQGYATGTYVSALADGSGDVALWACVQGDGIYSFDRDGRITSHDKAPSVETLFRDTEGRCWLGTANQLWSYAPQKGRSDLVATLPGERVAFIADLNATTLAVSTFGAGVALVDKQGRAPVRQVSMHDSLTHHLVNDWVYALDADRRGRLWVGTSSGVCRYDVARGECDIDSLGQLVDREECTALRVLASGDVLMATSRGLLRWSEAEGVRPEPGTAELLGSAIAYIIEDSRGDIWLSTNTGIWIWQPREQRLSAQTSALAQLGGEYVQGAGVLAADGHIMFATADAVTCFHPDSLRHRRPLDAEVRLTAFSNDATSWHMEFSLMDFATTASTVFEYCFEDDEVWQQLAPGQNVLTFTHMAPGRYKLLVRATLAGQTTEPRAYAFAVPPPWWQTVWAYCLYVLMAVAAATLAAWAYRRHIQHQLDRQKLSFLISAANDEAAPLALDELQTAISRYVQSRRQQTIQAATQTRNATAMAESIEAPQVSGNDEHLMQRITQSVNRHLGDSDFSVEQMCDEVGISRAHLHRKMKELTGFSATEFVRNIRLEQAARLLRERKLNITQVAYTVGFSNLGYFSTVFRKHFGLSPRDFVEGDATDTAEDATDTAESNNDANVGTTDANVGTTEQD